MFESEQLELEEFSNTTPLLIERPMTPPQDFPDQKYFNGDGARRGHWIGGWAEGRAAAPGPLTDE